MEIRKIRVDYDLGSRTVPLRIYCSVKMQVGERTK